MCIGWFLVVSMSNRLQKITPVLGGIPICTFLMYSGWPKLSCQTHWSLTSCNDMDLLLNNGQSVEIPAVHQPEWVHLSLISG